MRSTANRMALACRDEARDADRMSRLPWPVVLAPLLAFGPMAAFAQTAATLDPAALVTRIIRADYDGDRVALQRLYEELSPRADEPVLAARLRYWRGYALWRRVINGVNDGADPGQQNRDIRGALWEFDEARKLDPQFHDVQIAIVSCLQIQGFMNPDPQTLKELLPRYLGLMKEMITAVPDNPRAIWVWGGSEFFTPPGMPASEIPIRQARAIAGYERGLQLARHKTAPAHPLDPTWGEPELLMSLAWSYLNKTTPEPAVAEQHAKAALALVPHWHYVRDMLLPQIEKAKR